MHFNTRWLRADEISSIIPLLITLYPKNTEALLKQRLQEMLQLNYKCAAIFSDDGELAGICGIWELNKHYVGKHIEPDNVVIAHKFRGKGLGQQLMEFIHQYAIGQGCLASELNCYTGNQEGVRFWIAQGYRILGFHMQKKFKES